MLPGGRALRRARRRAGRGGLLLARMMARLMTAAAMTVSTSQKARVGSRSQRHVPPVVDVDAVSRAVKACPSCALVR